MKGNMLRYLPNLTPEEREFIQARLDKYPCGRPPTKPEHLGLVRRIRVIREIQLWALEGTHITDEGRWEEATKLIQKLGGKNIWDPL